MENRNELIVKAAASHATGKAEREVAAALLAALPGTRKHTVGADKWRYVQVKLRAAAHLVYEKQAINQPHLATANMDG